MCVWGGALYPAVSQQLQPDIRRGCSSQHCINNRLLCILPSADTLTAVQREMWGWGFGILLLLTNLCSEMKWTVDSVALQQPTQESDSGQFSSNVQAIFRTPLTTKTGRKPQIKWWLYLFCICHMCKYPAISLGCCKQVAKNATPRCFNAKCSSFPILASRLALEKKTI